MSNLEIDLEKLAFDILNGKIGTTKNEEIMEYWLQIYREEKLKKLLDGK